MQIVVNSISLKLNKNYVILSYKSMIYGSLQLQPMKQNLCSVFMARSKVDWTMSTSCYLVSSNYKWNESRTIYQIVQFAIYTENSSIQRY